MYSLTSTTIEIDQTPHQVFGIQFDHGTFPDITTSKGRVEKFIHLLNQNDVSELHILDLIYDFFT